MKNKNSGYLLFDKPCGWTSFDCVSYLKKKYHFSKMGHAGSLDPIASGLIIVMSDEATRWFDAFQKHPKIYDATLLLGVAFDTEDITGQITNFCSLPHIPAQADVECTLQSFVGSIIQRPPVYSAIKIQGRPAYEYARTGKNVEIPSRETFVEKIELIRYQFPHISFRVSCKKGFYVRTLCEDIARKLSTRGVLTSLRRISQAGHHVSEAFTLKTRPVIPDSVLKRTIPL